ncbi:MAG: hypothetical protein L3J03_03035 [Desulfobacterales bacterium]|nr:hypothetical protein [Desulfobacterales bacterium]
MIREILTRLKPGVPVRVHLLVAALFWTVVGFFLMVNGYLFLSLAGQEWLALVALAIGIAKGHWVMDRMARKNLARIEQLRDGSCLGSVYSFKTWGLILLMILTGRFLRASGLPGEVVGILYLAIGWALFSASRLFWRAWFARATE